MTCAGTEKGAERNIEADYGTLEHAYHVIEAYVPERGFHPMTDLERTANAAYDAMSHFLEAVAQERRRVLELREAIAAGETGKY